MNREEYAFQYTTMTKASLAQLYFPERKIAAARRKLNYWISHNGELNAALTKTGYSPRNIVLTPVQVNLIIGYLGEP